MDTSIAFFAYITIVLFAFVGCVKNWKYLKSSDKLIGYLLFSSLISEITGLYFMLAYKNNMYVYHFYSPIELFIIALYFQINSTRLTRFNVGIIIGCIGLIVSFLNAALWQPLHTINSIFLLFEGFTVISLCVFSFYEIMLKRKAIYSNTHFWFTAMFLIYWSCVFSYWGMYNIFMNELKPYMKSLTYSLWIVNILCYIGFAVLFWRYKKITTSSE